MKLQIIINTEFINALNMLSRQNIPIKTAFKLKGIIKRCGEEHEKFLSIRKEILEKYGEKDKNGKLIVENSEYKIPKENEEEAEKQITELLSLDIDVPTIHLFELGESLKITAETLLMLDGIVVE